MFRCPRQRPVTNARRAVRLSLDYGPMWCQSPKPCESKSPRDWIRKDFRVVLDSRFFGFEVFGSGAGSSNLVSAASIWRAGLLVVARILLIVGVLHRLLCMCLLHVASSFGT